MSKTVILTGSQGFIGSYVADLLLKNGYKVIGIDNYSKYGFLTRPHDTHPNFRLFEIDLAKDVDVMRRSFLEADYIIAGAAMIGGISYFHKYAYDLLATNERILANTFDMAINLKASGKLSKIIVLSSSMVFENTSVYPTPEDEVSKCPPPSSTYGFQKLAVEYFCKGAWEQYKLPYTIIRPFNCVGVGEDKSLTEDKVMSGNVELMMSHVVPDLINKILKGQSPLHILGDGSQVRCYTNGKDIARGIYLALENPNALNNDFNISSPEAVTVLELAKIIWDKLKPNEAFQYVSDTPYHYDVNKRVPDTTKAKQLLGFESEISLDKSIDEVIQYVKSHE